MFNNSNHLELMKIHEAHNSNAGNYSRLACQLLFERSLGYYLIHIYVPSSLVVMLSWVSFWLNRESAPARTTLGITTVLTMATLISSTNASLPKINYLKSVDVYLVACFFMVFASILEYACVSYIGRSDQSFLLSAYCKCGVKQNTSRKTKKKEKNNLSNEELRNIEVNLSFSSSKSDVNCQSKPAIRRLNKTNYLERAKASCLSKNSQKHPSTKRSWKKRLFVCCCYDSASSCDDMSIKPTSKAFSCSDLQLNFPKTNRVFLPSSNAINQTGKSLMNAANTTKSTCKGFKDFSFNKPQRKYIDCSVLKNFNASRRNMFLCHDMKARVRIKCHQRKFKSLYINRNLLYDFVRHLLT